jgi:drug/metabolite transporter (DMT)-like permease
MAPASRQGAPWAMLSSRVVPALVLTIVITVRRTPVHRALDWRAAAAILAQAVLAFGASTLYALATQHGQLSIVSVLGSLYPVVTVLLAYHVLGERVHRTQQLGIVAVLVGIVLMSA